MNWTKTLHTIVDESFHATLGMVDMVKDSDLNWKPSTGDNWMTTGQLLHHLTFSCGECMHIFVHGKWRVEETGEEESMQPAEKLTTCESIASAKAKIEADRDLAHKMIDDAGEEDLANKELPAPWNPTPRLLGMQLLDMVGHLAQHKAQLFYYLKLQGKPVHTGTMWGM